MECILATKGPKGDTGATGARGPQGTAGPNNFAWGLYRSDGSVTTPSGFEYTVNGDNGGPIQLRIGSSVYRLFSRL